jgi:hypothetical protein
VSIVISKYGARCGLAEPNISGVLKNRAARRAFLQFSQLLVLQYLLYHLGLLYAADGLHCCPALRAGERIDHINYQYQQRPGICLLRIPKNMLIF